MDNDIPLSFLEGEGVQRSRPINVLAGWIMKQLRISVRQIPYDGALLLRMPTELGFVVLEHLHPIDLHHLAQVSKSFRRLVMSATCQDIWQIAFHRHPELPRPPPGIDSPKWAFLLFGHAICSMCGEHGAMTDFAFCRRYCHHCMERNYRFFRDLRDRKWEYLSLDHPVVLMVPRSFRTNAYTYTFSAPVVFRARVLKNVFDDTIKKITILRVLVDYGVAELAEILNAYTSSRISYVSKHHAAVDIANGWAMETYKSWMRDRDNDFKAAIYQCNNRMKKLGCDPRDIKNAWPFTSWVVKENGVRKLTPKVFRKIEPMVQEHVNKLMLRRLKSERAEYLSGLYTAYQKTQLPEKWPYFSPPYLISSSDIFHDFLHSEAPCIGVVEPERVAFLFERLTWDWIKIHQEQITRLLRSDGAKHQLQDIKQFDSAALIMSCRECEKRNSRGRVLVGWDTILRHFSRSRFSIYRISCTTYRYNAPMSTFVWALLLSLGLDPMMITVQDMDHRKDRFLCGNCLPTATSRGILSLKVFTWLEFISHQADMVRLGEPTHCGDASWRVLTPEASKFVLAHEYAYPLPGWKVWSCNRCSVHYKGAVTHRVAIGHVQEVHSIIYPEIGRDVIVDKRVSMNPRTPFRLGVDPAYELRCNHCSDQHSITRIWDIVGLRGHVERRHQVLHPVEGLDWTRIKMIEGTFRHTTGSSFERLK